MNRQYWKMARPVARLRAGRGDWYRMIENKAEGTAEVFIYDEIGYLGVTAADFAKDLRAIKAPKITVHLDTPGGDVFDGLNIYNTIRDHPAETTIIVDALAASAGSYILQAGDHRIMNRHSQVMIHNAHGMAIGNGTDMRALADLLDKQTVNIANIYAERSGTTPDAWLDAMAAETWYLADEAVAAGLADEVADADKAVGNSFDLSVFSYAGREQAPAPVLDPDPAPEVDWAALTEALKGAFA